MKPTIWRLAPTLTLFFSVTALTTCMYVSAHETRTRWEEVETSWIAVRGDNICGLDDPKMLSKPAKVDYDALLHATSEMKKIKDDKIDPNSPQGIQLRQAAATRVQKAAEKVRSSDGYCSVWKTIRHQDGRAVADITDAVKAQL